MMKNFRIIKTVPLTLLMLFLSGCDPMTEPTSRISKSPFGTMPDGQAVTAYRLENRLGSQIEIIDLGGIITSLVTADKNGNFNDIVLGLDTPAQYITDSPYFGAIVGRYANRIANGNFSIDDIEYSLATNNGPNALHGGIIGFDKKIWNVDETFENDTSAGIRLSLTSPDGDEGYPGTLLTQVEYIFDNENQLTINYTATTDKTTVINLSQHTYFNLNGHASGSIEGLELMLNASHYTPIDQTLIPTGEIAPVENTPMDFRNAKPIGRDINNDFEQLQFGGGYDHNWALDKETENDISLAARVVSPKSGRMLEVYTDQPGIQFYTGNFLENGRQGKNGTSYDYRGGFCLETQHFPDSPNHDNFPSTLLKPDEVFSSTTIFKFSLSE